MPIFRRGSEPEGAFEPRSAERLARPSSGSEPRFTRIAAGNEMVGEITGSADVLIEGDLQGEVRIDGTVRVGPEGRVRGGLDARVLEIAGKVKGDVVGREIITLDRSAELYGNLSAPRVVIHEGAFFKGQVEMSGEAGQRTSGRRDSGQGELGLVPGPSPDDAREQGGDG